MKEKQPEKLTDTVIFRPLRPAEKGPRSRKAFLTIIHGRGSILGQSVVVEENIIGGRAPECGLLLDDLGVSRRHFSVTRKDDDTYLLEDLGSTNGTVLNDRPVDQPVSLREGDKIYSGDTVLRFSLADEIDVGFQREVARMLATDPLTGLESKRSFDHRLEGALQAAQRTGDELTLLMMDMDGIKEVNDTHGHLYGAHCIRTAGGLIGEVLGPSGHACRFGGDEFTAFLPGTDKASALRAGEEIRSAIDKAGMEKNGIALHPTISIGVASFPADGANATDLTHAADMALYRAKKNGKNRVSE
jgi:two-component system cell cycle response regulator